MVLFAARVAALMALAAAVVANANKPMHGGGFVDGFGVDKNSFVQSLPKSKAKPDKGHPADFVEVEHLPESERQEKGDDSEPQESGINSAGADSESGREQQQPSPFDFLKNSLTMLGVDGHDGKDSDKDHPRIPDMDKHLDKFISDTIPHGKDREEVSSMISLLARVLHVSGPEFVGRLLARMWLLADTDPDVAKLRALVKELLHAVAENNLDKMEKVADTITLKMDDKMKAAMSKMVLEFMATLTDDDKARLVRVISVVQASPETLTSLLLPVSDSKSRLSTLIELLKSKNGGVRNIFFQYGKNVLHTLTPQMLAYWIYGCKLLSALDKPLSVDAGAIFKDFADTLNDEEITKLVAVRNALRKKTKSDPWAASQMNLLEQAVTKALTNSQKQKFAKAIKELEKNG